MSNLISRELAIDALDEQIKQCDKALGSFDIAMRDVFAVKVEKASLEAYREKLEYLPSAESQIIRCKDCRYYKQFGKSEWGDCLALSRICKSIDFCSWGARMDSEQILSEADNDTAYGGLMSAT